MLQGYIHKLSNILLDHDTAGFTNAQEPMISALMEAASLYCCITAYNVPTLRTVLVSRMDTGQQVEADQLSEAFYTQFLVSSFT